MAKNITPKDLADVTKEGLTLVDFGQNGADHVK